MTRKYRKHHRIKKKKLIFKSFYFWLSIFLFILIAIIFFLCFFWEKTQLKEIKIWGSELNETEKVDEIEEIVFNNVEKKILFKKSRSIIFIRKNEIKKDILKAIPEFKNIEIKMEIDFSLSIRVETREPVAIFCNYEQCFNVDKEGIIFEKKEESNNNDFGIQTIEKNLTIKVIDEDNFSLGDQIIEETVFDIIEKTEKQLFENNFFIKIEEATIKDKDWLSIRTNENWNIYFNLQKNIDLQILKLCLLLKEKIPSTERMRLEYIDLRFTNRAYYK